MNSRPPQRRYAAAGVFGYLLTPGLALAQTLGAGGGADVPLWRVVGALILCLALAIGGAFALRIKLRGALPGLGTAGRRLRLVESIRLTQQVDVCLLSCDDKEFLIAATPHGALLIAGDAKAPWPAAPK
jgi:flagellar biogenesis protein FliO